MNPEPILEHLIHDINQNAQIGHDRHRDVADIAPNIIVFELRVQIVAFSPPQNEEGDRDQYKNCNTSKIRENGHQGFIVEKREKYANRQGHPNGIGRRVKLIRLGPELRHKYLIIFAQSLHEFCAGHDGQKSRVKHDENPCHINQGRQMAICEDFIQFRNNIISGSGGFVIEDAHTGDDDHCINEGGDADRADQRNLIVFGIGGFIADFN